MTGKPYSPTQLAAFRRKSEEIAARASASKARAVAAAEATRLHIAALNAARVAKGQEPIDYFNLRKFRRPDGSSLGDCKACGIPVDGSYKPGTKLMCAGHTDSERKSNLDRDDPAM